MMFTNSYKTISLVCYVLRLFLILILLIQICFYRQMESDVLFKILNTIYPIVFVAQMLYQLPALWVIISILYWSRVMGTK